MKVVICANGHGTRWNNFMGVPKHLLEIDGEPLLHRTVRLLQENGVSRIIISSSKPEYEVEGAERITPKRNIWLIDQYPLEVLNEPVTFLLGDVYFSENAIKTILNETPEQFAFFHTINASNKREEEVAIKVVDYETFSQAIREYRKDLFNGIGKDLGGRELRMKLCGHPYRDHHAGVPDFVVKLTPDETADFDWPEDYGNWMKEFRKQE